MRLGVEMKQWLKNWAYALRDVVIFFTLIGGAVGGVLKCTEMVIKNETCKRLGYFGEACKNASR